MQDYDGGKAGDRVMKEVVRRTMLGVFATQAFVFSLIMLICFAVGEWNASIAAGLISIHGMYTNKHITGD